MGEVKYMESIWSKTTELHPRKPLPGSMQTETAVIGGGLAGLLTAYFLQQRGVKTIVLEASRIGSGQTKNTTAKITSQHGLIYHKLLQTLGEEPARQYAQANQQAIDAYRSLIREKKIDCQFEECPAYLYSTVEAEPLEQEAEAARLFDIDARFTTRTSLPFSVAGAVRFSGQAQFHPLAFLQEIADELEIYEETRVTKVEDDRIFTDRGTVTARNIVFATHYPFLNFPGYYFLRQHQERSYVLALENAMKLDGMYLGIDENGLSFRNSGKYLLLGGGSHRTGENRTGGKYEMLRRYAEQFWPESREAAYWSAQDCMTLDGVPYIGQFSVSTPHWFVATGFQKWGMTTSMAAAQLLTDLITGVENPCEEVFSPLRFTPAASAKTFLQEGLHAVRDLSRQAFAPPRAEIDALPTGHGGVVSCEGEKVGVYKDEQGEVYMVSTRCPHLGCQLEWNPDEKSWDCPCHGSRFDYRGNLIDNPAQEGLPHA